MILKDKRKEESVMPGKSGPFRCPGCKKATSGDLRHCPNCGEALVTTCSGCGASWRYMYEYKFCPSCGTKAEKEKAGV